MGRLGHILTEYKRTVSAVGFRPANELAGSPLPRLSFYFPLNRANPSIILFLPKAPETRWCDVPMIFLKVPEGGCLRKCEALLKCGHGCPLVCHSYDEEHEVIACTAKCNRILCALGHVCPKICEDHCGPCRVIMKKEMPCGHTNELFCYIEPDDENVKCSVKVTVTLPACGHETKKPCYVNLNDAECLIKCRERLRCGHTCQNNCHKNKDPDHENYECRANCARTKSGCSVVFAEGDDFGEHKCLKMCYKKCDPCHVKVTKTIPECGHKVKVACSDTPVRELCDRNCEKVLACGHVCVMKCAQECGCDRKMDSSTLKCGHTTVTPTLPQRLYPNGHFYCIGECGGAMERGRGPECDATIGSTPHQLVKHNKKALELDN
ncbi:NFX1-type zinc finger-containing protein 1 [Eumeta japonica]|uniref:NFX1-type zinc finger-containing protein 1 n=1 Tax=Eumeta variegata TaxID=151549 RepID=A0A4C1UXZ1_EUMVA|nr:NFX1-type zinc finger-containing protein 1 [Eumeta japonica]